MLPARQAYGRSKFCMSVFDAPWQIWCNYVEDKKSGGLVVQDRLIAY